MSRDQERTVPVIVVDDLHVMRKAIRRTLEKDARFLIEEFANANEAIAFLKKNPVDLVISDIYMPNGDGFELLRYVRSRPIANDLPVVFVSGEATKDDIVHSADLGITDYILKPFEPVDLQNKVKSVLERYHNPPERVQMLRTAESWLLLGDITQSESMFLDLYALDPKSPRVLVGLAQVEYQKNNKEYALTYVNQAISINSMYFPAYALGANIHVELGSLQDAIDLLLRELAINGKQTDRRLMLADLYASVQEMPKAFEQLRMAILDFPKDEKLLLKMADFQMQGGDSEKAIHYFLKTRRSHPKSVQALDGVSKVAIQIGKPIKAIHAFTDLLKLNPGQKDILLARARLYDKLDDFNNAMADIDKYLEALPDSIEGWQAKAKLLVKHERVEESLVVWKKIVTLAPTPENMGKLALHLLKAGDFLGAANMYEKAVMLAPDNAKFYFNLACAYENLHSIARAIYAYENYLKLAPGNEEAEQAIERLKQELAQREQPTPRQAPVRPQPASIAPVPRAESPSKGRTLERKKPPKAS